MGATWGWALLADGIGECAVGEPGAFEASGFGIEAVEVLEAIALALGVGAPDVIACGEAEARSPLGFGFRGAEALDAEPLDAAALACDGAEAVDAFARGFVEVEAFAVRALREAEALGALAVESAEAEALAVLALRAGALGALAVGFIDGVTAATGSTPAAEGGKAGTNFSSLGGA